MKYYIATGLANHVAHNELRDSLTALGHEITYDWTSHGPVWSNDVEVIQQTAIAERDGVAAADVVIALLPGGRGTHVEIGVAIGSRIPVIIHAADDSTFGAKPETCAFYHAPDVLCVHAATSMEQLALLVVRAMKTRASGSP